jgi:four helix bundle protein
MRARSGAEFVSKIEGGLQELEETRYWLELLAESGTVSLEHLADLMDEAKQLVAILITCAKHARSKSKHPSMATE